MEIYSKSSDLITKARKSNFGEKCQYDGVPVLPSLEKTSYVHSSIMLVDIPLEKIHQLCQILEKEWPMTMNAINTLKRCKYLGEGVGVPRISILYSENNEGSGVVVTYHESLRGPMITVYALDGYEKLLKDELLSWNFPWTAGKLWFDHVMAKHIAVIEEITTLRSYKLEDSWKCVCFSMPVETALSLNIEYPENVECRPLSTDHLDDIYNTWAGNEDFTNELLKEWYKLDEKNAIGIFCKKTGARLSNCLRSYAGWIVALQTVESARNKGYAKLLLKEICKTIAKESVEPSLFTSDWHEIAQELFRNVGFKKIYDYTSLCYAVINNI